MKTKTISSRLKRAAILAGILFCSGAAALLAVNQYVIFSSRSGIVSQETAAGRKADCILVLGAGVYGDGSPSPMLRERLEQGLKLFELGASDRLLMSGDHGRQDYDEVNVMKAFAIEGGVPSQCVFMDHAGFSTYESLYRARDVFRAQKIVIVTQEYHLYRALYIAESLGLDACGVTADTQEYAGQTYREAREILARVKDFFSVRFMPEPAYLGQAVPVNGNGDATND